MEIEKKFLVRFFPDDLSKYECRDIVQGYLSTEPVLRVRKSNDRYILTYKSRPDSGESTQEDICVSNEIEAPLTRQAFEHLLAKCDGAVIHKKRYIIPLDGDGGAVSDTTTTGLRAELDVFEGTHEGLVFAEVEFDAVADAQGFVKPDWLGENVSDDIRFANNYLATINDREHFLKVFNMNGGKKV